MGKFLRVLVILILLLSIGALVLGYMLFSKREILKGRTQKLEKTIKELDAYIEAEPGTTEQKPAYPARDISPCAAEVLMSPERSVFWQQYDHNLEIQEPLSMLGTAKKTQQLMNYYQLDTLTGKAAKDSMGQKITKGKGTMQQILDDLLESAEAQYEQLNATRQQLTILRKEYVSAVEELNERKDKLRSALATITDRDNTIFELREEIKRLEGNISRLESEKASLEDEVAECERQIEKLNEVMQGKDREIASLKAENMDLRKKISGQQMEGVRSDDWAGLEPGEKGRVISVNPKWNFAVAKLSDAFMREILGDDLDREFRPVNLFLKRPGSPDSFVCKIRIIQVKKKEKLGIADIMTNWQQLPVREGDVLFR